MVEKRKAEIIYFRCKKCSDISECGDGIVNDGRDSVCFEKMTCANCIFGYGPREWEEPKQLMFEKKLKNGEIVLTESDERDGEIK